MLLPLFHFIAEIPRWIAITHSCFCDRHTSSKMIQPALHPIEISCNHEDLLENGNGPSLHFMDVCVIHFPHMERL